MNGLPLPRALPVVLPENPADRLADLFDTHHERVYRLARRLTDSADDALDLVQETFLRAVRTPQSIPVGRTSEEAWLVRTLVNVRRDQWRKIAVRKRLEASVNPVTTGPNSDQEAVLIARTGDGLAECAMALVNGQAARLTSVPLRAHGGHPLRVTPRRKQPRSHLRG